MNYLSKLPKLEKMKLVLRVNQVGEKGAFALYQQLEKISTLKEFQIFLNGNGLEQETQLKFIMLCQNYGDNCIVEF